MYTWTSRVAFAAAFLTGCTGTIEDSERRSRNDDGAGAGDTSGVGSSTGNGTAGSNGSGSGSGAGSSTGSGSGSSTGSGAGTGSGSGSSGAPGTAGNNSGTGSGGGTNPTVCTPGVPATSQLPRLTNAQYDNTIRDLLGITGNPSQLLAPDNVGSVDQRAWDGYQAAAAAVAPQVLTNAASRAKAIPCTPSGDGSACAQQMIQTLGQRAFRRPLTTDETARFMALYTDRANLTATGTFDEGAELIIESMLMSPSFLTRAELSETAQGSLYVLNGYEVASRLSYMLWGSMPDDALFDKAKSNALSTPSGILTEAKRMLMDPKARTRVSAFHESYMLMGGASRWSEVSRDTSMFPAWNSSLVPLLSEETKRFFDYMTFEQNGTFQDLVTKPVAFVNKALAPLYGLDPSKFGTDLVKTDLDNTQRAGAFTHAGFLASYSSFNRTSPILRGAFLQKQILCTPMGSPPAEALNTPVPNDASLVTNRQKVDAQTAGAACVGCHHGVINATGFALESYDGIGAWQTKEKASNAAVDSTADVLIGSNTVHVTGPVDLMNKIAAAPEAQRCYAQRWVQFAYERDLTSQDTCTAQTLASKMTQSGYTVQNLIADLTQSDSFRLRAQVTP